jgi:5-methylthioribose kinase
MDKHEQFKRLYKKFLDGSRWLNKKMQEGTATEKDKDEFNQQVVEPMDAMWAMFTDEEKDYWGKVKYAVDLFEGTIVLEDEVKSNKQDEERSRRKKKRWRKYSQSY